MPPAGSRNRASPWKWRKGAVRPLPGPAKGRGEEGRADRRRIPPENGGASEMKTSKKILARLEYLRGEIEAERISYEEIAELQDLAKYIRPGDVQLLEWARVPEHQQ